MSVLLLRLAGPLQAWGSAARFARRGTENAPTKSGVVGLLAAAQGRTREADLSDLAALRFGVRVDQPGTRLRDYQTAQHADSGKSMPVSERFYLADAVFVAGLECQAGDIRLLHRLYEALLEPQFLPYLGRRSCPPARPLAMDPPVEAVSLEEALRAAPWQASPWHVARRRPSARRQAAGQEQLAVLLDCPPDGSPDTTFRDLPLSFDPRHRRYGLRGVRTEQVPTPATAEPPVGPSPVHDPTTVLSPATPTRTSQPRNELPRD